MPTLGLIDCPHCIEDCLLPWRVVLGRGVTRGFNGRILMTKFTFPTVLWVIVACVALGFSPLPIFAQRGGHGVGGGFHGGGGRGFHGGVTGGFHAAGGGHYGYTGGYLYGPYHGGGYYGGHVGYRWHGGYGWHGGYWGYPHYGWGWSFGFGFGWPYWSWAWGYPYGYGYGPSYYAPYPYYCPPGYTCPPYGNDAPAPPPANSSPKSRSNPPSPWRPPSSSPNEDHSMSNVVTVASRVPIPSTDKVNVTATSYRVANSTTQQSPRLRPEVQRAMRALREMPPFAREREIETGRYSHFSPEEQEFLRSVN